MRARLFDLASSIAMTILLLWIVDALVGGFESEGVWALVKASLVVILVQYVVGSSVGPNDEQDRLEGYRRWHWRGLGS